MKSTGTRVAEAFSGFSTRGTVGALSLNVRIEDVNGVLIYQNVGGIQVLSKVGFGLKFAAVPRSDLLMNDERNAKPVEIAWTPLLTRAQEAGTTP